MNQYKPEYLGKVIPADNPSKLTEFVTNKFDAFNKVYDACKKESANISDIKPVNNDNNSSLSVKVSASEETLNNVREAVKDDASIKVEGGVLTANTESPESKK